MGVFDFIGRKYQEAKDEMQKAEMEAETWDPEQICNVLEIKLHELVNLD